MRDFYSNFDSFNVYSGVKSDLIISGNVNAPKFTVFIPTYKRSDTLRVTIESAINQFGADSYEIVIISNDPDGASGSVKELIESFNDDRIYYYVNEENIGLCGNWNRGIELARGEYVAMIHDDDMLSPWFVSSVLKGIAEADGPDILGVSYVDFNSSNMPVFKDPGKLNYREVSKESFFWGRYINIAGMTVNREFMLKLGGYADEYLPNEDTILIYQALLRGRVINIESMLAGYRQEINLSLKGDTMLNIVKKVEFTRRIIAEHEEFARKWMKRFDREYLYHLIVNANKKWGMKLDPYQVFEEVGLSRNRINPVKYFLMRVLRKIKLRSCSRT